MASWGKICVQLRWYLEFFLEKEESKIWEIFGQGSAFLLAIGRNVSCLGRQSLPSSLVTIHWCEPSQRTQMAHKGWFICSKHNKWLGQATYNYDRHKQVSFHCQCLFFFHRCQTVPCWWLTFYFFVGAFKWATWSCHLFMIFFCIQSVEMIPLDKFKEVIPNAQYKKCDNKIKKTWYRLIKEVFFEFMYKVNFKNNNQMSSIL